MRELLFGSTGAHRRDPIGHLTDVLFVVDEMPTSVIHVTEESRQVGISTLELRGESCRLVGCTSLQTHSCSLVFFLGQVLSGRLVLHSVPSLSLLRRLCGNLDLATFVARRFRLKLVGMLLAS